MSTVKGRPDSGRRGSAGPARRPPPHPASQRSAPPTFAPPTIPPQTPAKSSSYDGPIRSILLQRTGDLTLDNPTFAGLYEAFTSPQVSELLHSLTSEDSPGNLARIERLIWLLEKHHEALGSILSDLDRYDTEPVARVIDPKKMSRETYQFQMDAYHRTNARRREKAEANSRWIVEQEKLEELNGLLQNAIGPNHRGNMSAILQSLRRVLKEGEPRTPHYLGAQSLAVAINRELRQSEPVMASRSRSTPQPRK